MIAAHRGRTMIKSKILMIVAAASSLGGCENMSSGQKGAVAGARSVPASAWWQAAASARWSALA